MAKLPTRRELADKLDQLERDLAIFAGGAGAGAVLARSPATRAAVGSAVSPLILPTLAADVAIRGEESIPIRAGVYSADQLMMLAEGAEMRSREMGVTPTGPVIAPTVPVTKKKVSKFNKAISAGMKKVKASKSYGKKGTISNAKRAFKAVSKTVSGLGKRKTPAKGIRRAIATTPAAKIYKDEILRRKQK
jgi:hypothetical protein